MHFRRTTKLWPLTLAALTALAAGPACDEGDSPRVPETARVTPTTGVPGSGSDPNLTTTADPGVDPITVANPDGDAEAPGEKVVQPALAAEKAPAASPRVDKNADLERLQRRIDSWFAGQTNRRLYLQIDKPLYKPGETIWIRSWNLSLKGLAAEGATAGLDYKLISPKGATVLHKRVQLVEGLATNDFAIPEGVQGGEYTLRATDMAGNTVERPVIVSAYEPPRIKKKLEFVKKAYGAGDLVQATIEVKRPTGEPLGSHALTGVIRLDGVELPRVAVTTNPEGGAVVRFELPQEIQRGDGLLTVLVSDGGVTESISKRVPIILKKVQLSFFPEGGHLIEGLPSRVYFSAKNTIGKPADVAGRIVDDHGQIVARFETYKNGLGRLGFTPSTGRTYHAEITSPVGVSERYQLPLAMKEGCILRTYDDFDGQAEALRVGVRCTEARTVGVVGVLRDHVIDQAFVEVPVGGEAVVHLASKEDAVNKAQGVARVTLFSEDAEPLAERIFFKNRRARLNVAIEPDADAEAGYGPRDKVTLKVRTTTPDGEPVPAELALSVVDDTVVSFADDKTGHMLSRLYLEPELPEKVEEPNFYFDLTEAKSAMAMDLLMGTKGYRRFEWRAVTTPEPTVTSTDASVVSKTVAALAKPQEVPAGPRLRPQPKAKPAKRPAVVPPAPPADLAPAAQPAQEPMPEPEKLEEDGDKKDLAANAERRPVGEAVAMDRRDAKNEVGLIGGLRELRQAGEGARLQDGLAGDIAMDEDKEWAKAAEGEEAMDEDADPGFDGNRNLGLARANRGRWMPYAKVRVFPAPTYASGYDGPRTDFRETIHWAPSVKTNAQGEAEVAFYLSDAVTSFRVFSEGVAGGFAGRDETVIKSSLPFSMSVKLPLEVTAGDRMLLPLTLSNERDEKLSVKVDAALGDLVALVDPAQAARTIELGPRERKSLFYEATVSGDKGASQVAFMANAAGLRDEFQRTLKVVPLGFPIEVSRAGELKDTSSHTIDLGEAIAGSISAQIKLYPSPVATMVSGLEGIVREPHGCFEQASSSNYPNVMVMNYLQTHEVADVALLERARGMLDRGYAKLTGYESKDKGYEWFGANPAHEALTAYGLVQFVDMKPVFEGVDAQMVDRTKRWLMNRRDGKGGFKRNSKALDSFGRASAEVTNGYIIWSLTEAGERGIKAEIESQAKIAATTNDAYLLALATNTLLNIPERRAEGQSAAKRLAALQDESGAWTKADHSVTRSGGNNLYVETTALAVMALLKDGQHAAEVREGVKWLNGNRSGFGNWGATQATILSLKAMTRYAEATRATRTSGKVAVLINGAQVGEFAYEAGHRGAIEFKDLGRYLQAGKNVLELRGEGAEALPYSVAVEFRSKTPASSDQVVVDVDTKLARQMVKMGENVRLTATVVNKTAKGQPMTLARVGLPGGLTYQTWQLKELRDKGIIDFYETREREVVLYWRDMEPSAKKEVPLDLVAVVPGTYEGPASSGYLYYTDDHKDWVKGLPVTVMQ